MAERIGELDARITALESGPAIMPADTPAEPPPAGEIDLDALTAWVADVFLTTFRWRPSSSTPWCARWADHPEAVTRLEGCRRAWLELAGQPTIGLSVWLRDHADPCLAALRLPNGPLALCAVGDKPRHHVMDLLPFGP